MFISENKNCNNIRVIAIVVIGFCNKNISFTINSKYFNNNFIAVIYIIVVKNLLFQISYLYY